MRKLSVVLPLTALLMFLLGGLFGIISATAGSLAAQPASLPSAIAATSSVNLPGSFQTEVGCAGDWDPTCAITHLTYDSADDVWQGTFTIPAGSYEYKAALNDSLVENYGQHGIASGVNITLNLPSASSVKFYYVDKTHWVTDNVNSKIVVAAGSMQSELGCPGDWAPDCLRSWLEDLDGDGVYTLLTSAIPAGAYEFKATLGESWGENYGAGGLVGGANIPFVIPSGSTAVLFRYTASSHLPEVFVTSYYYLPLIEH